MVTLMRPFGLLLTITLSVTTLRAQVHMPATTRADLAVLVELSGRYPTAAKLVEETQGAFPTALIHGRCMVGFLAEVDPSFDASASTDPSIVFGARKGNVLSLRIDADGLDAINDLVGVRYIELAGKVKPDLDRVRYATHADSVHRGIDLPQSYTGRDVLIGITDWGFDYQHPNFYDTAMVEYRVRAAWDHYRQSGPPPADYSYGTELTTQEALLGAGADTANIYNNATHGSHVAGITGGGGAGSPYRGLAYDARFLFCTFLVDAAAVLDGFEWMQRIAEEDGKRLVINMSWGLHHIGTLDGNSLISQAIDQFSAEGVVFVNSGGNNGDANFHLRKDFTGDTLRSRIQFYPYDAHPKMWGQSISMWGDAGNAFSAGLIVTNNGNAVLSETPWYNTASQLPYLDSMIVIGADTVYFNLTADAAHPQNGRPHFRLRAKNRSSQLKVALKATAMNGRVHCWNVTELTNDVGNWGMDFQAAQTGWVAGNNQYGISEPACTESLISVAAYWPEFINPVTGAVGGGAVADFSSLGPTLDERVKPDIASPGVNIGSSMSSYTDETFSSIYNVEHDGRTFKFARLSGTSMASPAVAGIAALVLEADPTSTPQEVKEAIMHTARTDSYTGTIPAGGSTRWGAGKVNAYQAVREVLWMNTVSEQDASALMVWPNPVSGQLRIGMTSNVGSLAVEVMDPTGRALLRMNRTTGGVITLDVSALASGVYIVRCSSNGVVRTNTFVKD